MNQLMWLMRPCGSICPHVVATTARAKKKKKKEKGCGINLRNTVLFLSTTIKTWQRATEGAAACRSAALIWTNLLSKLNYEFLMSLITEH